MPIYEYQCPGCGHSFEKLQKMSDDPITDCPECGGDQVKKLVSQSAFILKGSGWYKDHYGLKKGGSGASEGASASSSTGSDAKPAAAKSDSGSASSTGSSSASSSASGSSSGSSSSSSSTGS